MTRAGKGGSREEIDFHSRRTVRHVCDDAGAGASTGDLPVRREASPHLGPDPDDPGGDPIIIDSQQLSIFGIADNSIAPSTGSFASLDGELAFDYSKFALSSLIVQTDPDLDPEVLEGSDYFFFAAPTVAIGGFGKGNTLLFGGRPL